MRNFLHTARYKLDKLNDQQVRALVTTLAGDVDFYLSVLDSLRLGIIVVDFEGTVQAANKMARIIAGRNVSRDKHVWKLFEYSQLAHDIRHGMEQRKDFDFKEYEIIMPRKPLRANAASTDIARETKIVRCALLPFVQREWPGLTGEKQPAIKTSTHATPRKSVTGAVLCIEDISSEREQAQQEYRDKSFASMRQMTAGIAHELKNPLGAISMHLQLLRRKLQKSDDARGNKKKLSAADVKKMLSYINIIDDEIQTMDKVVGVFLNDFKIQPTDMEPANINQVLVQLLKLIRPDLQKNGVRVFTKYSNTLPKSLISIHAITHVFLNVIKNSVDAMESGGDIIISTEFKNGKVRVIISDTGMGISAHMRKNIFDPYFTTKSSGSGIGLTVAYKLAQLHGGTVALDSSYKNGASFVITLPPHADEQRLLTAG